jgi:hypothetical protein
MYIAIEKSGARLVFFASEEGEEAARESIRNSLSLNLSPSDLPALEAWQLNGEALEIETRFEAVYDDGEFAGFTYAPDEATARAMFARQDNPFMRRWHDGKQEVRS